MFTIIIIKMNLKLREIEILQIFKALDVYEQISLQRVCKYWKHLLQTKIFPKYLQKNHPRIFKLHKNSIENQTRMVLDMLKNTYENTLHYDNLKSTVKFIYQNNEKFTDDYDIEKGKYDFDYFYLSKNFLDEFDKSKTYSGLWKLHLNIAYKQYRVWRFRHFILHRMNDEKNGEIKFITRYPVYDSRHLFVVHRKKYDREDEDELYDYDWAAKFKIQLIDSEDLEFGLDPMTSLQFNAKKLFLKKELMIRYAK